MCWKESFVDPQVSRGESPRAHHQRMGPQFSARRRLSHVRHVPPRNHVQIDADDN